MFYSYREPGFCGTCREHITQMIKAVVLNCIVLCRASFCVKPSQKKLYKITWRDTVSVQNNYHEWQQELLSALQARPLSHGSRLHFWYVFVTATLSIYTDEALKDILCAEKWLFLWNTNRVEIAICLPEGKKKVGQVPFVSYPHFPPTSRLYSVWLSWSNIWFVSHT